MRIYLDRGLIKNGVDRFDDFNILIDQKHQNHEFPRLFLFEILRQPQSDYTGSKAHCRCHIKTKYLAPCLEVQYAGGGLEF